MADARLEHLDPRLGEAVLDLLLEQVGHQERAAPQRDLALVVRVVGVQGRQVPHGGLALHVDEVLVVVHVEDGLGGVHDPPHHDRGDVDGVAVVVVHLELRALEVAHAQGDAAAVRERVHPPEALVPQGAQVRADELHDLPLVRVHDLEAGEADAVHHQGHQQHHHQGHVVRAGGHHEAAGGQHQHSDEHQQHHPPRRRQHLLLAEHDPSFRDVGMISLQ